MTVKAGEDKGQEQKGADAGDAIARFSAAAEQQNDLLSQIIAQNKEALEVAKKPAAPVEKKPVYTEAQLEKWVESGEITRAVMIQTLVQQGMDAAAERLTKQFEERLENERTTGTIANRIQAYRAQIPELNDPKSPEFASVLKHFNELRADGEPNSLRTQLLAMRMAYPEGKKPEESAEDTTASRVRTTETTGGGGGRSANAREPGPKMSPAQREHYARMIKAQRYEGWDDPKIADELKRAEKKAAQRAGRAA